MRDCKRGVRAENIHPPDAAWLADAQPGWRAGAGGHLFLDRNCREVRAVNNHLPMGTPRRLSSTARPSTPSSAIRLRASRWAFSPETTASATAETSPLARTTSTTAAPSHLEGACNGFEISDNIITDAHAGAVIIERAQGERTPSPATSSARAFTRGQGGIALGDSRRCSVVGNVFEEAHTMPAITAGPGGGEHVIASNNITRAEGEQIVVKDAPGCLVSGNLVNGKRVDQIPVVHRHGLSPCQDRRVHTGWKPERALALHGGPKTKTTPYGTGGEA